MNVVLLGRLGSLMRTVSLDGMEPADRPLVFRTIPVIATASATVLTILGALFPLGAWINEHAVWILWGVIVVLIVLALFLAARLAAVADQRNRARARLVASGEAKATAHQATWDGEVVAPGSSRLSVPDQALADELYRYASDQNTLRTLGEFFAYQIPRDVVNRLEALSELHLTRAARDSELDGYLASLTGSAAAWLQNLRPLLSTQDGKHYTTRLGHYVSEQQYQAHQASADELETVGFALHDKFLMFQRFYASL